MKAQIDASTPMLEQDSNCWKSQGLRMPNRRTLLASIALLIMMCLGALTVFMKNDLGMPLSQMSTSDPALQSALESALTKINERRKLDRSTNIDCSAFFADFNRYEDTEFYVSFFASIRVNARRDDANGKHYVYFELMYPKLAEMGFSAFFRSDMLVIVFTTASAASVRVVSFKSNLLGGGLL
jgi:hypothetical protein